VHIPCTWTNKIHKNLKKFTHVLSILLQMCIKFQGKIPNNEGAVKRQNFWQIYSPKLVRNFSLLLQINYNEFNLEILYTDEIEWKEHIWFFKFFCELYLFMCTVCTRWAHVHRIRSQSDNSGSISCAHGLLIYIPYTWTNKINKKIKKSNIFFTSYSIRTEVGGRSVWVFTCLKSKAKMGPDRPWGLGWSRTGASPVQQA
jgi:hypothetical protein